MNYTVLGKKKGGGPLVKIVCHCRESNQLPSEWKSEEWVCVCVCVFARARLSHVHNFQCSSDV